MIDIERFESEGFAMAPALLSLEEVGRLITLVEEHVSDNSKRGSVRDVLHHVPELQAVAANSQVREIVDQVLGSQAFVVGTTLFDKTSGANWKVPWHQDVTIAVKERRDVEGYGPWSSKEGIAHVQPPAEVLQRMVTVRVHLDPCPASNGALRVIPGSHHLGRINQNDAPNFVRENAAVCCEANPGDVLVMRPLLLHASSSATQPAHRRVLHFDFAAGAIAKGLQWRMN